MAATYLMATRLVREMFPRTLIALSQYPYYVDLKTGIIDYEGLEKAAIIHRPQIITAGASAYSRLIDYDPMRAIADKVGALLHCDMSPYLWAGCCEGYPVTTPNL